MLNGKQTFGVFAFLVAIGFTLDALWFSSHGVPIFFWRGFAITMVLTLIGLALVVSGGQEIEGLTKEQMIASMKTSAISDEYVQELEGMTRDQVAQEFNSFGRTMRA